VILACSRDDGVAIEASPTEGTPFDSSAARLVADPKKILTELGVKVPEGTTVKLAENTLSVFHPVNPSNRVVPGQELSDADLASAAGGGDQLLLPQSLTTAKTLDSLARQGQFRSSFIGRSSWPISLK